MRSSGLTPKQATFVREYLVDLNKTQAAIRCGYAPKSAATHGVRLFRNAKVRAEIDAALQRRAERVDVKADDVLRELMEIAFAKPGTPSAPRAEKELDPGPFGGALERLRGVTLRYEHKLKALELLAKHLGLLVEKLEVKGSVTLEQLVTASLGKPGGAP